MRKSILAIIFIALFALETNAQEVKVAEKTKTACCAKDKKECKKSCHSDKKKCSEECSKDKKSCHKDKKYCHKDKKLACCATKKAE